MALTRLSALLIESGRRGRDLRHIPLTREEHSRYDRLLKKTRHVAPYRWFTAMRFDDPRWRDTMTVLREWKDGNPLLAFARAEIERLVADGYGPKRKPH